MVKRFSLFSNFALAGCLVASLFAPTQASGSLIGYWDLNDTPDRTAGSSGYLDAMLTTIGIGGLRYGEGTSVNLYGDSVAGKGLEFYEVANVMDYGWLSITGLDFSQHTSPTLSFAFEKADIVDLFSIFLLEINIGDGWETITSLGEPPTSYGRYEYTFDSGELDGLTDVGIRLYFVEALNVMSSVKFDNILITAQPIPEPSSFVLVGAGAVLAAGLYRQRRKR